MSAYCIFCNREVEPTRRIINETEFLSCPNCERIDDGEEMIDEGVE